MYCLANAGSVVLLFPLQIFGKRKEYSCREATLCLPRHLKKQKKQDDEKIFQTFFQNSYAGILSLWLK
jgi:hypothetical protein